MTTVDSPSSIETIGAAFFRIAAARLLFPLGSGIICIEQGAFSDCWQIENIYCKAQTPPAIVTPANDEEAMVWDSDVYYNATLFVPAGTKTDYMNAEDWRRFAHIEEFDVTGTESVLSDAVSVVAKDGRIVVSGTYGTPRIEVYNATEQRLYIGTATTINVPTGETYLVRIADKAFKIASPIDNATSGGTAALPKRARGVYFSRARFV